MTGTQLPRAPWPWADPFWWAERQFDAAALMLRLTGAMVNGSVPTALGATGRTAGRAAATAQAATATVTAPAPLSAPGPVPQNDAERAWAGEPLVPGWDELTLGSIRARLRRLSEEDLVALYGYEQSRAARPDVLSMLQNRLSKVRSEY